MNKKEIIRKINEYIPVKNPQFFEKSININELTFTNLRDRLIGLGKIMEENYENNYYVVNVPAGIADKNMAVVLMIWTKEKISLFAYAKEGLINQHTADKAAEKVIEKII